ncbi:bifunctional metallophosphatase/5'-nucleotidase [Neobacillus dielmonensis]|uniref:bifunctional metallophosphatase/5'-nucleotidase n=1 Tax=Neobacillus dielmonensis TaxID=1347369 RepID=UPI0005A71763|nr:bifunctional UDP-sugar hydrolase/5'-nucleotidase [Neobacillus dielmonensis]
METIHIYHTNDLHSHLENWPRIQQFLKQSKIRHQQNGDEVLIFDIGDFIDRWHPYTEATMGKASIHLLNDSQYDAVTIGNNEGVNLPHDDLHHLYDEAEFEVLTANFYLENGEYPSWIKPYTVIQTKQGTRIGVLGLTAPFPQLYQLLGWKVTDPLLELKKLLNTLKKQADMIVLLSHLGIREDERIAELYPEVDVLLGAHTHHVFENGKIVNHTFMGAAGKYGYYVGEITLKLDEERKIIKREAIAHDIQELPSVQDEIEQAESYFERGKMLLSQNITFLQQPLKADPFKETELSKLLCQALKEWCKTDCAMINAGLLLGPLAGAVTDFDLLTICPHPINPCVIELTGQELLAILHETKQESLQQMQIKGLGFRGHVIGKFIYAGLQFNNEIVGIDGKELELSAIYTLALPDMFTFGHFFKDVLAAKQKHYFLPEFLRDILKWKLQQL